MRNIIKILSVLLIAAMAVSLAACGSSETPPSTEPAAQTEPATQKETKTTEAATTKAPETTAAATEETTQAPTEAAVEYLEPAETAEPGHFSDPEAFKLFDSYVGKYSSYETYSDSEVVLGKTLLKEHYTGEFLHTRQYADKSHEAVQDPEKLEAGAVGTIQSNYVNGASFNSIIFVVYNSSDAPAAFEDCVIIGFEDDPTRVFKFSDQIQFITATMTGKVDKNDPREAVNAILGEPYEQDGEISDSSEMVKCCWRDESGEHVLKMTIWGMDGNYQVVSLVYKNFALIGE